MPAKRSDERPAQEQAPHLPEQVPELKPDSPTLAGQLFLQLRPVSYLTQDTLKLWNVLAGQQPCRGVGNQSVTRAPVP